VTDEVDAPQAPVPGSLATSSCARIPPVARSPQQRRQAAAVRRRRVFGSLPELAATLDAASHPDAPTPPLQLESHAAALTQQRDAECAEQITELPEPRK
jgi:hypothetical protein